MRMRVLLGRSDTELVVLHRCVWVVFGWPAKHNPKPRHSIRELQENCRGTSYPKFGPPPQGDKLAAGAGFGAGPDSKALFTVIPSAIRK